MEVEVDGNLAPRTPDAPRKCHGTQNGRLRRPQRYCAGIRTPALPGLNLPSVNTLNFIKSDTFYDFYTGFPMLEFSGRCVLTLTCRWGSTLFRNVETTKVHSYKFVVFHPEVLQHTNKYYTSVNNTTFILYTMVYMSGRHVST